MELNYYKKTIFLKPSKSSIILLATTLSKFRFSIKTGTKFLSNFHFPK